ncbi:hypothetical protein MHTCC0001_35490 [Flavobacteriaceae bacterium MHTCC 0001]
MKNLKSFTRYHLIFSFILIECFLIGCDNSKKENSIRIIHKNYDMRYGSYLVDFEYDLKERSTITLKLNSKNKQVLIKKLVVNSGKGTKKVMLFANSNEDIENASLKIYKDELLQDEIDSIVIKKYSKPITSETKDDIEFIKLPVEFFQEGTYKLKVKYSAAKLRELFLFISGPNLKGKKVYRGKVYKGQEEQFITFRLPKEYTESSRVYFTLQIRPVESINKSYWNKTIISKDTFVMVRKKNVSTF